jgi:hypothetical protein
MLLERPSIQMVLLFFFLPSQIMRRLRMYKVGFFSFLGDVLMVRPPICAFRLALIFVEKIRGLSS